MRIKQGDQVIVIAGNDKGATGEVLRVMPKQNKLVVSGVNIVKKHQKPQQAGRSRTAGGIIEFEAPIDASNVMIVDPESGQPTRISIQYDEDGRRLRIAKRSGQELD